MAYSWRSKSLHTIPHSLTNRGSNLFHEQGWKILHIAYAVGFLHHKVFVLMITSSRSLPRDATRQFVQTDYLPPDNFASCPQVSLCFRSAGKKKVGLKRKKGSSKDDISLSVSLNPAGTGQDRGISGLQQMAACQMLLWSSQFCWEVYPGRSVCILGSKESREIPFRNLERKRCLILCTTVDCVNLLQILLFTSWEPGCLC